MNDKDIDKWFKENNLYWMTEWIGDVRNPRIRKPVRNTLMDGEGIVEVWYSKNDSPTDRMERAMVYLKQKNRDRKLEELGI